MNEELVSLIIVNIPNFAGFMIAIMLMYRIMMTLLAQVKEMNEQLRKCLEDTLKNHTDRATIIQPVNPNDLR